MTISIIVINVSTIYRGALFFQYRPTLVTAFLQWYYIFQERYDVEKYTLLMLHTKDKFTQGVLKPVQWEWKQTYK